MSNTNTEKTNLLKQVAAEVFLAKENISIDLFVELMSKAYDVGYEKGRSSVFNGSVTLSTTPIFDSYTSNLTTKSVYGINTCNPIPYLTIQDLKILGMCNQK